MTDDVGVVTTFGADCEGVGVGELLMLELGDGLIDGEGCGVDELLALGFGEAVGNSVGLGDKVTVGEILAVGVAEKLGIDGGEVTGIGVIFTLHAESKTKQSKARHFISLSLS